MVRNRVGAAQVNAYDREDVVQATLPIKASRIILSPAATKPNVKDQHYSSGVGWRRMKAWYGERETNKRWGHEVKNILMGESVVAVPTTIVSENHGYVTHRTDSVWRYDRRTPPTQKEEKEPTKI